MLDAKSPEEVALMSPAALKAEIDAIHAEQATMADHRTMRDNPWCQRFRKGMQPALSQHRDRYASIDITLPPDQMAVRLAGLIGQEKALQQMLDQWIDVEKFEKTLDTYLRICEEVAQELLKILQL